MLVATSARGSPMSDSNVSTVDVSATPGVDNAKAPVDGIGNAKTSVKLIDFKKINVDWIRNPRDNAVYSGEKSIEMGRSLWTVGLQESPTVSLRKDGTVWLIKGHRRYASIELVRTKGLPAVRGNEFDAKIDALLPQPDFMAKVKCIVVEGLSMDDELTLLMDHGRVLLLDRREKFRAIKTMTRQGFSEKKIQLQMGTGRTPIQTACNILKMPQCVEDAYINTAKDAPVLNDATITSLFKAYNADKKTGTKPGEAGPEFAASWEKFVAEGKTARVTPMKPTVLVTMAEQFKDSDLTDLLVAISVGKTEDACDAINRLLLRMVPVGCVPFGSEPHTFQEEGIVNTVLNGVEVTV